MNDNLDDFLSSLGIESPPATVEEVSEDMQIVTTAPSPSISEEPQPQTLSSEDFDDILENFGFTRPEDAQIEEIQEGNSVEEVEVEYTEESRDLDAEENADWEEAMRSGSVIPVAAYRIQVDSQGRCYTLDNDGNRVYLRNEVVDAVNSSADNEVHSHMPDGDVVDVPILNQAFEEGLMTGETVIRVDREGNIHNSNMAEVRRVISEMSSTEETAPALQNEPLIPPNSPTLLIDDSTVRFSGAEWYNEIQKKRIIFGGIGGIGSNCAFQLARLHPASLVLYDDDTVEMVNMAGQLYSRNDIGKSKVAAISDMISSYTSMENVYALKERFDANTEAGDIMMCGFDNMKARQIFFDVWRDHVLSMAEEDRKKCLYLDGRLSMSDLQVFCITGDDGWAIDEYVNKYLFDDSEAEHTVCSMKQTTYLACMIGSIMTNLFTNWVANSLRPVIPYDLPFFTEYDAQNMIFKTSG